MLSIKRSEKVIFINKLTKEFAFELAAHSYLLKFMSYKDIISEALHRCRTYASKSRVFNFLVCLILSYIHRERI